MIVARIVLADLRRNWARLVLAVAAVGAAIATVTWSLGTVATAQAQHRVMVRDMAGEYDAWAIPDRPDPMRMGKGMGMQAPPDAKEPVWGLTAELAEAFGLDARVARMDLFPLTQVQLDLSPAGSLAPQGPRPRVTVAGTDLPECPYGANGIEGRWLGRDSFVEGTPVEIVVSSAAFWRGRPALDSPVTLVSPRGLVPARIVGFVRQQRSTFGLPTAFVSAAAYAVLFREEGRPPYDAALLRLKAGEDVESFRKDWNARLQAFSPPCRIDGPEDVVASLDAGALSQFRRTAPLLLGLSGLAAIVIVITTLSLGLRQRIRMFALLRAVGAARRHLYAMTLLDGIVITALGSWVGLCLGWIALRIMVANMPSAFPAGAVLGGAAVRGALACGLLGVAGAALLPCVQAARMRPLDVLQGVYSERRRVSVLGTALGLLLLLPAPVVSTLPHLPKDLRCTLLLALALPAVVAGCALLTPLAILVTEKVFAGLLCRLAGLEPRLLRAPLSRQMGRVAGAVVTVSLALGLYTAIETWGRSMLKPFLPSPGFPDVIVSFLPNGLPSSALETALATEGFRDGQVFPLESAQFTLADETRAAVEANDAYEVMQNNVLVLGVDASKAFGGTSPMLDLPFVQGSAAEAAERLAAGGACVVPQTFTLQSRLGVGDRVGIQVADGDGVRVQWFEIAGVVDANWHLVTARSGLRGLDGSPFRTLAVWFVGYDQARALAPRDGSVRFLWGNLDDGLRSLSPEDGGMELTARLGRTLGPAISGGGVLRGSVRGGRPGLRPDLAGEVSAGPGAGGPPPGGGRGGRRQAGDRIQISHRDVVFSGTSQHAGDIIGNMSRIPLWALGILSLSIVSAVVASVQARRLEFGRMRALGLSRSQLLRLVCVEGILIGLAACLVSLMFGLEAGWCFTGYTRAKMMFGGLPVAFQLPWRSLLTANGLALGLALAAAILPALQVSRREAADLLRDGNAE